MGALGSRIPPHQRLAGARGRIYEALSRSPGITHTDLSARSNVTKECLRYHARLLEKWGHVKRVWVDRHARYFVRTGLATNYEALAYAQYPVRAKILQIVRHEPGLRQHEIAKRYGNSITRLGVGYHLRNSLRYGLLTAPSEGPRTYWPCSLQGASQGAVT